MDAFSMSTQMASTAIVRDREGFIEIRCSCQTVKTLHALDKGTNTLGRGRNWLAYPMIGYSDSSMAKIQHQNSS